MKLKFLGVLMLCIFLLTLGSTARAATVSWKDANTGDWSDITKWVGGVLPAVGDTARINNGNATLDSSQTIACFQMGATTTPAVNATLNISNGSNLTVTGTSTELLGLLRFNGSTGTVNHSKGTVTVGQPAGVLGEVRLVTGSGVTAGTANYNLSDSAVLDTQILSRGLKSITTANFNATGGTLIIRNKINKFGRIAENAAYGFNQGLCTLEVGAMGTIGAITIGDTSNTMDYAVGTGGTLDIDIASATSFDTILQYGDVANTLGATLNIDLGYTPDVGSFFDVWTFFNKAKAGSGLFTSLPSNWTATWVDTSLVPDGTTDTLRLTYIPEPATIALLGLGLLAIRRNKK
jgi:hypothetical protein